MGRRSNMRLSEYIGFDATGLTAIVKAGDASAQELLSCAMEQSAKVNPNTNAICRPMEEQAKRQIDALKPEAPFAEVPFLIKDGVQDYAGVPTSYESRSMLGIVPAQHSNVLRRYLESGLLIVGKTNLPEFALKAVTDSKLWGRANNPWDLNRTPGGSSGSAAAAVASGVVPMAAANDGGGSIRIPASYCGWHRSPRRSRGGRAGCGGPVTDIRSRSRGAKPCGRWKRTFRELLPRRPHRCMGRLICQRRKNGRFRSWSAQESLVYEQRWDC